MGRSERTPPTAEEYARYPERFSNRGRWGDDDEFGTLNPIDAAARAQGITPRAGDGVCIRSGRDEWGAAHPDAGGWSVPAGVHASACELLYDTDAAVLCWDMLDAPTADQGLPNPIDIETPVHLHCVTIPPMGMPLLDNADFRGPAQACARNRRWEFLLVATPLVIDGGTGSPINPIACF